MGAGDNLSSGAKLSLARFTSALEINHLALALDLHHYSSEVHHS
jgi:hypothetical protein